MDMMQPPVPVWSQISMIGLLFILGLGFAVAFLADKQKSLTSLLFVICMVIMFFAMLAPAIYTSSRPPMEPPVIMAVGPAMISMIGLLFILGLFFAAAFFAVKWKSLTSLLVGVAVVAALLAFFMARVTHNHANVQVVEQALAAPTAINASTESSQEYQITIAAKQNREIDPSAVRPHDRSLDELWDKLTKSRINLGDEAKVPAANSTEGTTKDPIQETSSEKEKLPPSWVTTPPKWVGQVYRETVASEPFVTEEECRRNLEHVRLPRAVARRIESIASGKAGGKVVVTDPLQFGIGPDYILREIGREEFTSTLDSSVGEMKEVHVLLEFDKNVDDHLLDAWLQHERQLRFASVSKIAALSLTGLAAIYGMLRFDTWSKGYYSRQLLVGGTLAIIALAVILLET
jgi:hypothetical protein